MMHPSPFDPDYIKPDAAPDSFSAAEVGLANRNHGVILETLALDVTPIGAHYLLNHFDVPIINASDHYLDMSEGFSAPKRYRLDDIKSAPAVSRAVTLECAGNGRAGVTPRCYSMPWTYEAVGTAIWTGTPLWPFLEAGAAKPDTVEYVFVGQDYGYDGGHGHHFARSLSVETARALDVMLVYAVNDQPLPPQHGGPLRIIVPGWYGMASVKWLTSIRAVSEPFQGYQQVGTYRYREKKEDTGLPITDIRVKSLMVPPGVPEWTSRARLVSPGTVELVGRAWSGAGRGITKVEVSDGGPWIEAELGERPDTYAWTPWRAVWNAKPGEYVLQCRATDETGAQQPLDPPWDAAGFGNNAVQKINVFVQPAQS